MEPTSRQHVHYTSDGSQTPFAVGTAESRHPRTTSQTVSISCEEADGISTIHAIAECVETKIVTTTTTTKRVYPPLGLPQQPLTSLKSKEYPLAQQEVPDNLAHFKFGYEENVRQEYEGSQISRGNKQTYLSNGQSSYSTSNTVAKDTQRLASADLNQPQTTTEPLIRRSTEYFPESPGPMLPKSTNSSNTNVLVRNKPLSQKAGRSRRSGLELGMHQQYILPKSDSARSPVTSDLSELEPSGFGPDQLFSSLGESYTPHSGKSRNDAFDEDGSQQSALSADLFASAVATPPIADSDLEPLDAANAALIQASAQRPTVNTSIAQNASLPSPGLSPTYHGDDYHEDGDSESHTPRNISRNTSPAPTSTSSILATGSILRAFEAMPTELKSFMMFQFLKRCPMKTLHIVANVVNPALKYDFLGQLPAELGDYILSYLNHRDLARAAQVSKKWRNQIDPNEKLWKKLFDADGFVMPAGELDKAIKQGWGWQDPYGPDGFEDDLSPSDTVAVKAESLSIFGGRFEVSRSLRSTKRKRTPALPSSERSKRRAVEHDGPGKTRDASSAKFENSGPETAASAAALAVPEPASGDSSSLRNLHLFKSLYRRHYLLKSSWTGGKIEPRHFAFPAHPRHVITCLQFDDDKILTGSDDTLIHVYDTKTGTLRKKLEGHEGGVWALQYEGNVLVSGSTDRSVRVWDIEKGLCTQVFHGHTSTVRCLQILMPEPTGLTGKGQPAALPEKPLIITGSRDSQLRVWRLPEQGEKRYIQSGPPANDAECPYFVRVLQGHTHSVRAIAANQDTLVSGSYDNSVRVWRISTGETIWRLLGHQMKVYSVVLDTKRNRCISGSMDNFVKIWSLETGQCLYTLEGHTSLVGLLDLRDERLVSAAADSTLRIWDPENGQCKSTLTAHTGAITCFQHDGQKVISGSDRTLKMWNIKTGECVKDLLTDLSGVWQVKFDQRRCVAAVQRDGRTFVEVIDFGASRDGVPCDKRGFRDLVGDTQTYDDRAIDEINDDDDDES
ncbi:WD40-repeat-containing domain protein [Calycina marina]|uniref:WD40-repeat-containing domain protein n=1 Tax=Calycina marina TaxID=1763456 RepID=A0A9P7Z661_9HELO|nr:WD40-repeat-containing domain protein [Calycina marina]